MRVTLRKSDEASCAQAANDTSTHGRRQGQAPRSFDPLVCLREMNMRGSLAAATRAAGARGGDHVITQKQVNTPTGHPRQV